MMSLSVCGSEALLLAASALGCSFGGEVIVEGASQDASAGGGGASAGGGADPGGGGGDGGDGAGGLGGGMSQTPCSGDDDCEAWSRACELGICDGLVCRSEPLPIGANVAVPIEGDCRKQTCDGVGGVVDTVDATDPPASTACLDRSCSRRGDVVEEFVSLGTPCGLNMTCDGEGNCRSLNGAAGAKPGFDDSMARSAAR